MLIYEMDYELRHTIITTNLVDNDQDSGTHEKGQNKYTATWEVRNGITSTIEITNKFTR